MLTRREFVHSAATGGALVMVGGNMPLIASQDDVLNSIKALNTPRRGPICIASANGLNKFGPDNLCAVEMAVKKMRDGAPPVEAVVAGVNIVEDDPRDHSVGYGGLPNENGVVELDASVMDGPSGKCGAVAAIQRIKNPSSVALLVMRRTDHVLLVGEGALRFARAHGFQEMELLTEDARKIWMKWKESLSPADKWLSDDEQKAAPTSAPATRGARATPAGGRHDSRVAGGQSAEATRPAPVVHVAGAPHESFSEFAADMPGHVMPDLPSPPGEAGYGLRFPPADTPHGTINCLGLNERGEIGGVTTTSGLAFKIPGRVGDSPIIGAGLYVDNAVGAAGSTGRGEANLQNCASFLIVELMRAGKSPTEACLEVLKRIADKCEPRLRNAKGEPDYGLTFYALAKDGRVGGANMRGAGKMAFHDGTTARAVELPGLYAKDSG